MQYIIPPKAEGQKADPGKVMFLSHRYYQYFSGRFASVQRKGIAWSSF